VFDIARSFTPDNVVHGADALEISLEALAGKTLGASFNISLTSAAQEHPAQGL
jgi:hypothetical protein